MVMDKFLSRYRISRNVGLMFRFLINLGFVGKHLYSTKFLLKSKFLHITRCLLITMLYAFIRLMTQFAFNMRKSVKIIKISI